MADQIAQRLVAFVDLMAGGSGAAWVAVCDAPSSAWRRSCVLLACGSGSAAFGTPPGGTDNVNCRLMDASSLRIGDSGEARM